MGAEEMRAYLTLKHRVAALEAHDHCCTECNYHSTPHKKCILR